MELRTLGNYQIRSKIGQGGMAVVYLAEQPPMRRQVAIKVLPEELATDPELLARFEREMRLISTLEHPRILPVYDFGEQNGLPYIVMRYLPGGTLADLIASHPGGMPFDQTLRLVDQMAEGLDFAHSKSVMHRDFKPGNIFFDQAGNAYIADFGLARAREDSARLTGKGSILGTPHFMAPELADREADPGPSVDVYALAVTIFLMLTGSYPYTARKPMEVLLMHVSSPIPDVTAQGRDLPPALHDLIAWGLAKEPGDRIPSAGHLAAGLRSALSGFGSAPAAAVAIPFPSDTLPTQRHVPGAKVSTTLVERESGGAPSPWLLALGGLIALALLTLALLLISGALR